MITEDNEDQALRLASTMSGWIEEALWALRRGNELPTLDGVKTELANFEAAETK